MSISQQFAPDVDEFIDDLETFASGSYLGKDEKEFWDQPFDPSVLPTLRTILMGFLTELDLLPASPGAENIIDAVTRFITAVETFNVRHADAVIEPEEFDELNSLIFRAITATGFIPPEVEDPEDGFVLPRFE
ncbi:hypothetical protein QWU43_03770 [Corynebacterium sp. CCM 9204]